MSVYSIMAFNRLELIMNKYGGKLKLTDHM